MAAALVLSFPACSLGPERDGVPTTVASRDEAAAGDSEQAEAESAARACAERIAEIVGREPDHELAKYEEKLAQILLTSKIVPVVYLSLPETTADPEALGIRAELGRAKRPERKLRGLVRQYRDNRPLLRDALLSEGYLFENRPGQARALVSVLRFADLFDDPAIHLHRGGRIVELRRDDGEYVDDEGVRAKLLLNDRVAVDRAELDRPLHLDLDEVRQKTGALDVTPFRVGKKRAAVRLAFPGGLQASAVLASDFPATEIVCTDVGAGELERAKRNAARFWQWTEKLRGAAESMVSERLPFDEPKDEEEGEQEDGHLRKEWLKAYLRGRWKYELREEKYRVYDYRGNPTPPQVCIDFVFDTLERASGTWFRPRGRRPGRDEGFLDFSAMDGLLKRQTISVLEFAELPETPLERYDIPQTERVPFRRRGEFAAALVRHAHEIREGDILIIHGLREEDLERHFHSVLVLRTDPMTGMPMVVADNAGRPRIRPLASAMRSAPRRSIKYRVRIDFEWIDRRWREFEARGAEEASKRAGQGADDSSSPSI